jgi:hypothetical protein
MPMTTDIAITTIAGVGAIATNERRATPAPHGAGFVLNYGMKLED